MLRFSLFLCPFTLRMMIYMRHVCICGGLITESHPHMHNMPNSHHFMPISSRLDKNTSMWVITSSLEHSDIISQESEKCTFFG